jgi:DNA-binding IclR family transcriptional regulator
MATWSLLSNHGRVLLCLAHDPEMRLRDLGASLSITERRAFDLVNDLTEAGYVIKEKDGRRNRYRVQEHLPLPEVPGSRTLGDVLSALG